MEDVEAAVIAAAEEHLRACQLADQRPRPDDCLPCYLHRALRGTGCDGKLSLTHEWQGHQRVRRRRTGGLTAYLKSRGGFCDCEVLMNVYPDREPDVDPGRGRCSHPAWR
jgi:hypothetical protein